MKTVSVRGLRAVVRALAWVALLGLGLGAIVGSGGSVGFPPCNEPWCSNTPPPPTPSVRVDPAHVTAQVGAEVTLRAITAHTSGATDLQWLRSADGGQTFTPIGGATGDTLRLPAVNLADDGAVLRVRLRTQNHLGPVSLLADSRLLVSSVPGIVYQDGEFLPQDWTVADIVGPNPLRPLHLESRVLSGGNPGAYRAMHFTLPQGTGSGYVVYLSRYSHAPQTQGAVRVIDYAEDCAALQASELMAAESALVLVQGERTFVVNRLAPICIQTAWRGVSNHGSLAASDFRLFDGPACGPAERCPDFSATALPLRLGYWRLVLAGPGQTMGHAIDNWKVTLWPQP